MAFEQYLAQEWESISTPQTEPEKTRACFDCSICLDFARDPVVTLCGHLYCWPCIYNWFISKNASPVSDELHHCPVCKAKISEKTMIPLYGRGESLSETESEGKIIPPRPPACNIKGLSDLFKTEQQLVSHDPYRNPHNSSLFNPNPTVGMLGEMVYARVFGNSQSLYTYPNSYHSVASGSPSLRRREVEANKSLNRVTIFLFCCLLLCLLVF